MAQGHPPRSPADAASPGADAPAAGASIHATCLVVDGAGILLRGGSGSGKSDLALRAIIEGAARLVADDRVLLQVEAVDGTDRLVARPPRPLAGKLEVRGIGIVDLPFDASALVDLIVDLAIADAVERLPDLRRETVRGISLPVLDLAPFEASATAKLRLAARIARSHIGRTDRAT